MAEKPIGDNPQDFGLTSNYVGSVTTVSTPIPTVAGNEIATALIRCPSQTPNTRRLLYSFDNVTFLTLTPGEFVGWSVRGSKTQIFIKGNVNPVDYEVILNTEQT